LKTGHKPRATAEARNDYGQSLLSIAVQRDDEEMATMLLTEWKVVDDDLFFDSKSQEVHKQVWKTNPNSRDLKGWSCVCVAVFHKSKNVLPILLAHGGDPTIRSSYNKNAWDLAKDEVDALGNVMESKLDIRQVLIDFDNRHDNLTYRHSVAGDDGTNINAGAGGSNSNGPSELNDVDSTIEAMMGAYDTEPAVIAAKKKASSSSSSLKKQTSTTRKRLAGEVGVGNNKSKSCKAAVSSNK